MPLLKLREIPSGPAHEFDLSVVRIGRDPGCEICITGAAAGVVSVNHLRLIFEAANWFAEDLGSRNGTYVDERRLAPHAKQPFATGAVIGLGERGPRFAVELAARERLDETLPEAPISAEPWAATLKMAGPAAPPPPPPPPARRVPPAASEASPAAATPVVPSPPPPQPRQPPPQSAPLRVVLKDVATGDRFEAAGTRVRLGRGRECEIQPSASTGTSVSRVHAEIVLTRGIAVVRDARSRNGTLINGVVLAGEHQLVQGDRVQLGQGGPELSVELLVVAPPAAASPAAPKVRRSFGGMGRTVFIREVVDESSRRSAARIRAVVWTFVGLLILAVGALWWYGDQRVRRASAALSAQQEEARVSQQAVADSMRRAAEAEYNRLRLELDQARTGSAPAAVVESLRVALTDARERTTAVETALNRAQAQLADQLAAGDSLRRRADAEMRRLRAELGQATASQVSGGLLDSLRRELAAAQERSGSIDAQIRAVRGVNLAALAQANQAAVGLVSVFVGGEVYDGSGFVVTRSGYFITNRHVVAPDNRTADSIFVTMADQRFMSRAVAAAVATPDGPDLAVLKIAGYQGPHIGRVDWTGAGTRQGEPAALIGFPAGVAAALDETRTVRTSMSAGIFSKVTAELLQFDGFTVGGSSGSPIFNANGEVVAVHRAGLREAAGLGFAVPIRAVLALLPPDARAELGLN